MVKDDFREIVVRWEDPCRAGRSPAKQSGKVYLDGVLNGTIPQPPAAKLIGYSLTAVEKGRVIFSLEPSEVHLNPFGTVHGGIITTILDAAMTGSVLSAIDTGFGCSTIEIKVNFIRAISQLSGTIMSEGRIEHLGKKIATAQARLYDDKRNLCALAMGTVSIFRCG